MKSSNDIPKGFTLIELLVVIAIISLLVSILLPSLARAKDLARTAICSTILRSVGGTGLQMYAIDYDGCIPPDYPGYWKDLCMSWPAHLGPYLGFPPDSVHANLADPYKIVDSGLECPDALPILENEIRSERPRFHGGYGLNMYLDGEKYNVINKVLVPPPTLDELSGDAAYLTDGNLLTQWNCVGMLYALDEIGDYYHHPDYRHHGESAVNVVYIGGHVQTVDYESRLREIRLSP